MAVGASKPSVLANADGFFSVKNKILVSCLLVCFFLIMLMLGTRVSPEQRK